MPRRWMVRASAAVSLIVAFALTTGIAGAQTVRPSTHPDPWFGIDKVKHFFMSAFINSFSYSALQATRMNHSTAMAGAISLTMAVGLGRELHDMRVPGNIFSVRDLTWDAIGTTAGAVLTAHTIR